MTDTPARKAHSKQSLSNVYQKDLHLKTLDTALICELGTKNNFVLKFLI